LSRLYQINADGHDDWFPKAAACRKHLMILGDATMTTIALQERVPIGYSLEYIFSFTGRGAGAPEAIGQLPEGLRVNFQNVGGEIQGPRLQGKLHAFGGDWVIVRKDGLAILDAGVTLETDDGALIMATYPGTIDFGEDGYEKFRRSDFPPTPGSASHRGSILATQTISGSTVCTAWESANGFPRNAS
jgi:hypothetical protein